MSKDKFKVGDEVFDVTAPETRAVVTRCVGADLYMMFSDGSCGIEAAEDIQHYKKTGRRFKIEKIFKKLK